MNAEQQQYVM